MADQNPTETAIHPADAVLKLARRRAARKVLSADIVRSKGLNQRIAIAVTNSVGTMWAFYVFAIVEFGWMALAAIGVIKFDPYPFAFLLFLGNIVQLLLLPLIMVGQNVQTAHADARAEADFEINTKAEEEIEHLLVAIRSIDSRCLEILRKLEAQEATQKAAHQAGGRGSGGAAGPN